jgi:hypothetical protein
MLDLRAAAPDRSTNLERQTRKLSMMQATFRNIFRKRENPHRSGQQDSTRLPIGKAEESRVKGFLDKKVGWKAII